MPLRPWLVLLLNKFNLFDDMFCWKILKNFFSYKFIKKFSIHIQRQTKAVKLNDMFNIEWYDMIVKLISLWKALWLWSGAAVAYMRTYTVKPVYLEHVDNWFLKIYLLK